jgi:hypothetical protein
MAIGRVVLAPSERRELERRARSRTLEAEDCKRAKLILLLAKGHIFRKFVGAWTALIAISVCGRDVLSRGG